MSNATQRGKRTLLILALIVVALTVITAVFQSSLTMTDARIEIAAATVNSLGVPITANSQESLYTIIDVGFQRLKPVFERACFDCHSTRTRYPWYHKLPVIRGLIDRDVREGLSHLDMTRGFPFAGHDNPLNDLARIKKQLRAGEMPLLAYRMMHWGAAPNDAEKARIYSWVDSSLALAGWKTDSANQQVVEDSHEHDHE